MFYYRLHIFASFIYYYADLCDFKIILIKTSGFDGISSLPQAPAFLFQNARCLPSLRLCAIWLRFIGVVSLSPLRLMSDLPFFYRAEGTLASTIEGLGAQRGGFAVPVVSRMTGIKDSSIYQ